MSTKATVTTGPDLPSVVEMDSGIRVSFDQADGPGWPAGGRELEGPSSTQGVSAALELQKRGRRLQFGIGQGRAM